MLKTAVSSGFGGRYGIRVLDEIAKMRIFIVADRRLHRDRFFGNLEHLANLIFRHLHAHGEFFRRRLASHFLQHLARDAVQFTDRFDHVHRDANGARLVGDRARDGLADPPSRIG